MAKFRKKLLNKKLKRHIPTFMTISDMEKQFSKHIVWHFINSKNDYEIQLMQNWQLKYLIDRLELQNSLASIASCIISISSLILVWFNNIVGVDKDATITAFSKSTVVHTNHQKVTFIDTMNFIRKYAENLSTSMFQCISIFAIIAMLMAFLWSIMAKQRVRNKLLMEYYRRTESNK